MTPVAASKLSAAIETYLPEIEDPDRRQGIASSLKDLITPTDDVHADSVKALELLRPVVADSPPAMDPYFNRWFEKLVVGWTERGRRRLEARVDALSDPSRLAKALLVRHQAIASQVLIRTLLELLGERRDAGYLEGRVPKERFQHFHSWLFGIEGIQELSRRYPGSVLRAYELTTRAMKRDLEVIDRFVADRDALSAQLGVHADARISVFSCGSGDTHDNGRSVAVVDLGEDGHLVYKPRPLSADRALAQFTARLAEKTGIWLKVPRVLDCGNHGWAEFITAGTDVADFDTYSRSLGQLTGVLHVLGSRDMHHENVITDESGRPVIIDAETILTPDPSLPNAEGSGAAKTLHLLAQGVQGIGVLPMRLTRPGRVESVDVGVAGNRHHGQGSPFGSLRILDAGLDTMRVTIDRGTVSGSNANPQAGDDLDRVHRLRDGIHSGMSETLRVLIARRDDVRELLVKAFADVPVRHVNHPTMFYGQLLRMSTHPSALNDAMVHLAVLGRVTLRNVHDDDPSPFEVEQMLAGDTPIFTVKASEIDLLDARGGLLKRGFFNASPLDRALHRLASLDEESISLQTDMVDVAFTALVPDGGERTSEPETASVETVGRALDLGVARLVRRWVPADDAEYAGTFWGPLVTTDNGSQWTPGALHPDLYGGSSGLALALAAHEAVTGDSSTRDIVDGVIDPLRRHLVSEEARQVGHALGAMTGAAGATWSVVMTDRLLDRRGHDHHKLLTMLSHRIEPNHPAEFTTGATGALAAAAGICDTAPPGERGQLLDGATDVVRAALPVIEVWLARLKNSATGQYGIYTGYAHGLAGILGPMARAHTIWADRDERLAQRLRAASDQVAKILVGALGGMRIPRVIGMENESWAWCHGSPGIILGLLEGAESGLVVEEDLLLRLSEDARRHGLDNNSTLCHGDPGTLHALIRFAEHRGDYADVARWRAELRNRSAADLLRSRQHRRDRYASADGLMVGSAGSLLSLLRSVHDAPLPDPLTLSWN